MAGKDDEAVGIKKDHNPRNGKIIDLNVTIKGLTVHGYSAESYKKTIRESTTS